MVYWYEKGGKIALENNQRLMRQEAEDDEAIKQKMRGPETEENASISHRLLHGIINLSAALPLYEKYLSPLIDDKKSRRRFFGGIIALFIAATALPVTGILKSEFFRPMISATCMSTLKLRSATGFPKPTQSPEKLEEKLLQYKEIDNFSTTVGASVSLYSAGAGGGSSNKASITINLVEKDRRKLKSYELEEVLRREFAGITDAKVTVVSLRGGPTAGSAFQAEISGPDLDELKNRRRPATRASINSGSRQCFNFAQRIGAAIHFQS